MLCRQHQGKLLTWQRSQRCAMDLADNTVEIQPTIQEDQVERIKLATKIITHKEAPSCPKICPRPHNKIFESMQDCHEDHGVQETK